jgi:putative ABC transport system substrate-binding protein
MRVTDRRRRALFAAGLIVVLLEVFAPRAGESQSPKVPLIVLISAFSARDTAAWHDAFRQGLHELGRVEGQNMRLEYRYTDGVAARLPGLLDDVVRLKPDVIVTSVTGDTRAARNATRDIPIVMASVGDPVGAGLVQSLSHPGGNLTGLSQMAPDLAGKRIELLKAIVPRLSRVAVLWNPSDVGSTLAFKEGQASARALKVELHAVEARTADDLGPALDEATRARAGALVVMPGPLFVTHQKRIAELAAAHGLPSIFHLTDFVDAGGLLSYGPDRADLFRRAAVYVDKILKGAKPADLPVERPTKFVLAINLRTAKVLRLDVSPSLRLQADKVVE